MLTDLINSFLTAKTNRLKAGQIVQRTFDDYKKVCDRVIEYFGKSRYVSDITPADFEQFRKLLQSLKAHRVGIGFYSLRRTFATVGSGTKDQVAVDFMMGHSPSSSDMSAVYRQ